MFIILALISKKYVRIIAFENIGVKSMMNLTF